MSESNGAARIRRTDSADPHFQALVHQLDSYLTGINGEAHGFYSQYNKPQGLKHCVVAYLSDTPVGCGAFRPFPNEPIVEIKRMFVLPEARRSGVARAIVDALSSWAKEEGYERARLETSRRMEPAVTLYKSSGFEVIPNYGQYKDVEDSICMERQIN